MTTLFSLAGSAGSSGAAGAGDVVVLQQHQVVGGDLLGQRLVRRALDHALVILV